MGIAQFKLRCSHIDFANQKQSILTLFKWYSSPDGDVIHKGEEIPNEQVAIRDPCNQLFIN